MLSYLPVSCIADLLISIGNFIGGSRPAQGNARMVIPKGQVLTHPALQRRRTFKSASRTTSYPAQGHGTPSPDPHAFALQQGTFSFKRLTV